jgi:hypothetical protein
MDNEKLLQEIIETIQTMKKRYNLKLVKFSEGDDGDYWFVDARSNSLVLHISAIVDQYSKDF